MKSASYISAGLGRSARACQAEERGLLPLSRITSKKGIKARLQALGLEPEEWHHTGKFARETDYWKPAMVRAIAGMSQAEFEAAYELREARWAQKQYYHFPCSQGVLSLLALQKSIHYYQSLSDWNLASTIQKRQAEYRRLLSRVKQMKGVSR